MNSWSDINVFSQIPIETPKKKEDIDWLEEVNKVKRECRIKTKVNEVIYPNIYRSYKYKNYTESYV